MREKLEYNMCMNIPIYTMHSYTYEVCSFHEKAEKES